MKPQRTIRRSVREEAAIGSRALKDPQSVEFAWQTVNWLKGRFHSLSVSEQHWKDALAEAEQYRIYTRVPPEKPYGSMTALLKAEIGVDTETSLSVVRARTQQAAQQTKKEDAPTKQGQRTDIGKLPMLSQSQRARENGISPRTQRELDRLAREAPEHLARVQQGKVSVRRACIEAGHITEATPLEAALKAYHKLTPTEKQQFLTHIQTEDAA